MSHTLPAENFVSESSAKGNEMAEKRSSGASLPGWLQIRQPTPPHLSPSAAG
jgi:hypothetical protein